MLFDVAEKHMKDKLYDDVTEDGIVKFLEQWMSVLGHLVRYPATNRAVVQGVIRLYEMLPLVLGERDQVEFAELHDMILVNGKPLSLAAQEKENVGAFVFVLLKNNVRAITINRRVSAEEFQVLLEIFHGSPEDQIVDVVNKMREARVRNITVEQHVKLETPSLAGGQVTKADEEQARSADEQAGEVEETTETESRRVVASQHARTEIRPAGANRIHFTIHVGGMVLAGAEVSCEVPLKQQKTTNEEGKATLFLPLGENEVIIRYEQHRLPYALEAEEEDQLFEIDLQQAFKF